MDIFDKYSMVMGRRDQLLQFGSDPFAVNMEEMYSSTEGLVNGKRTILVGTNNYMGVTFEPTCIEAACDAIRTFGTGTTGSRIANGTYELHQELEREIADFLGRRSAIVFSTGYQANLGMLAGLAGPKDTILMDSDSHSSMYDGCRLSGATIVRFRHNDPADLDRRLSRLTDDGGCRLVIVEGLYSMLGDRPPLREFVEVKKRHGAFLFVDEAHSLGVIGQNGRGVAEEQGVEDEVDFVAGTFSKSLGSIGGFGASNHPNFDILRYTSRPYMFTASPSPSNVASVLAALRLLRAQPERRKRLWDNAQQLYDGLAGLGFEICAPMGPVIALRMRDELTAFTAWNLLLDQGVYVNLALPPGTPNGACLLRCSLSAAHTPAQVDQVIERFQTVLARLNAQTSPVDTQPVAKAGE